MADNFNIVTDVAELPSPVRAAFQESGGDRILIANPHQRFNSSDVLGDPAVPRERLMFAGISNHEVFVFYERGGIGLSYVTDAFRLDEQVAEPLWRIYCVRPASDLSELRKLVGGGECN
jgi:hypothetical protein